MILPGPNLRTLREKLGLTMGDVETASGRLARKYNNEEYLITTSRLSDFETKRVSRAFTPLLAGNHLPSWIWRNAELVWSRSESDCF